MQINGNALFHRSITSEAFTWEVSWKELCNVALIIGEMKKVSRLPKPLYLEMGLKVSTPEMLLIIPHCTGSGSVNGDGCL